MRGKKEGVNMKSLIALAFHHPYLALTAPRFWRAEDHGSFCITTRKALGRSGCRGCRHQPSTRPVLVKLTQRLSLEDRRVEDAKRFL